MRDRFVRCRRCITLNEIGEARCSGCGAPLEPLAATAPVAARSVPAPVAASRALVALAVVGITLALLAARGATTRGPARAPAVVLPSTTGAADPCIGAERCLAVYLAPWCSACKESLSLVQAVQARCERDPRIGLKVVVGRDGPARVKALAAAVGGQVFLDFDETFRRAVGNRGVPEWWMWDRDGRLVASLRGSPTGAPLDQLVSWVIDAELGSKR